MKVEENLHLMPIIIESSTPVVCFFLPKNDFIEYNMRLRHTPTSWIHQNCNIILIFWNFLQHVVNMKSANYEK